MLIMWELPKKSSPIFSSTTQRLSTTLHMENHKKLLFSLIVPVYISTALILCKMFQKVTSQSHNTFFQTTNIVVEGTKKNLKFVLWKTIFFHDFKIAEEFRPF